MLELTFLRNDRFERKDRFGVVLPHPLDIRSNVRTKPPVFLDDFFRGRPPSEKESLQMLEVRSSWQFQEEAQLLEERSNLVIEKLKSEKEKFIRERDVALSQRNAAFAERDIALAERDMYRRKLAHVIRYPWKHAGKFIRRKKTNV
ncbi:hypothetical protein [Ruegeria sp. HKCCD7255]|uniref:hypothetical protein n=1 Tax=Ruegeria sp. HKCCD7255 TaxID=2683004 RepID=UPI001488020F|nr:hypothetical protein [Ruegeria sp. HKCCD7255]